MLALIALSLAACADRPLPFPLPVVDAGAVPMDAARPPLTPPDIVTRACLRIGACGLSPPNPKSVLPTPNSYASLSGCVSAADPDGPGSGLTDVEIACISSAPDCTTAANCLNGGLPQQPCPSAGRDLCDGNDVISCFANTTLTRRTVCAAQGLKCFMGTTGALCGISSCDSSTQDFVCMGNAQFGCFHNVLMPTEDCAAEGGTCVTVPPGIDPVPEGKCVGITDPDPCAGHAPGDSVCSGSNRVVCGGGSFSCGGSADYCQNGACITGPTCKTTCDGTLLTACLPLPEGKVTIDCAAEGFTGCDATIGRCTL
ncbi:MAG TPA: hypothetical protein VII38_02765 [Polyangia bacterium]